MAKSNEAMKKKNLPQQVLDQDGRICKPQICLYFKKFGKCCQQGCNHLHFRDTIDLENWLDNEKSHVPREEDSDDEEYEEN